ncbi:MAG: hypothetical protein E7Y34_02420 [Mycoplasma sp.]|nr:hypothetical protein [Mycoplasma sp.]
MIDPRTIQFSDLLSETYKDFNIFTLENHMVVHKWIRAGFIKYGFGVKIKPKKENKEKPKEN